jgi:endonuclease-3
MAKMLQALHGGQVPADHAELMELPGVGRKTANVITSVLFDAQRIAVDTHVFRVASRLGLTHKAKTPLQAEQQLVAVMPSTALAEAHHLLILHGRYTCKARKPACSQCNLAVLCPFLARQTRASRPTRQGST